ncbi:hypothetical protein XI05_01615 [Bradyrhizobium sp. CCBAU 11357]|nr:hypothetical protein [Bradyrhizobium sp. CCBAU 11357]
MLGYFDVRQALPVAEMVGAVREPEDESDIGSRSSPIARRLLIIESKLEGLPASRKQPADFDDLASVLAGCVKPPYPYIFAAGSAKP